MGEESREKGCGLPLVVIWGKGFASRFGRRAATQKRQQVIIKPRHRRVEKRGLTKNPSPAGKEVFLTKALRLEDRPGIALTKGGQGRSRRGRFRRWGGSSQRKKRLRSKGKRVDLLEKFDAGPDNSLAGFKREKPSTIGTKRDAGGR